MHICWWYSLLFLFFVRNVLCIKNRCVHIDYRGKKHDDGKATCPDNKFCKRSYNISYVEMPPYSWPGIIVEPMLRKCCGKCVNYTTIHTFTNITGISPTSISTSDFIIPFLGSSSKETLYGYYFIPVCFAPSAFYITAKPDPIFIRLIESCGSVYPLIIICLFMAVIAGFIVWIMETRNNKEEFPRSFFPGWLEGIWWSFIFMATGGFVGESPKSIPTRVFSILCCLIGITMFSMLTGLLTEAIIEVNNPVNPDMINANVGVLKYREYDASMVAMHGGAVIETNGLNFFSDIILLITKLRNKEVDGILLDKFTYMTFLKIFMDRKNKEYYLDIGKDNAEFFMHNTIATKKTYDGERLSYGVLVKDEDVYEYFRDTLSDNRLVFETGLSLNMTRYLKNDDDEEGIFSPYSPVFILSVEVMAGTVGAICVFGIVYELLRRVRQTNVSEVI